MAGRPVAPGSLVLDAEGLSKAAAGDGLTRAHLVEARRRSAVPIVSAVTLTEVLRGTARDAAVHRVLNGCRIVDANASLTRRAGVLIGANNLPGTATIDGIVAATALAQPGPVVILTSDVDDLLRLTQDARARISVVHV